jgi:type IV fimbrial biogenesis protein FimT
MRTSSSHQRGFSLIEIAVTLVVLSLLIFATAPGIGVAITNARMRSVADSIQVGLQSARMEAMRRNVVIRFEMMTQNANGEIDSSCAADATGAAWAVSQDAAAGACDVPFSQIAAPRISDRRAAGLGARGMTIQGIDATGAAASLVVFDSLGQAVGVGLTRIDITSNTADTRALRVEMTNGGIVRLCEPAAGATDPRRCLF